MKQELRDGVDEASILRNSAMDRMIRNALGIKEGAEEKADAFSLWLAEELDKSNYSIAFYLRKDSEGMQRNVWLNTLLRFLCTVETWVQGRIILECKKSGIFAAMRLAADMYCRVFHGTKFTMFSVDEVEWVYSGKKDGCCCGCNGTYRYHPEHREAASKRRGYAVADENVSIRSCKIVLGKFNRNLDSVEHIGNGQYTLELGNRLYMIQLTDAACGE